MTMKKGELLELAKSMKLDVSDKNTIAEINEAIKQAKEQAEAKDEAVIASREAKVAKAGKRSEKALKEAEEKAEKEARKEAGDTSAQGDAVATKEKGPAPKTRSLLERRSKKYQAAYAKIDKNKVYSLDEATKLVIDTNPSKFDASVEVHARLGVDPRQADQNIRATVSLPHGTGKKITVAVFAPKAEHDKATKAGADIVADEEFLQQLDKGVLNFDILITTPAYMPKLGKYARTLGPRGLMPNPKSGTISADVAKATTEAKAGKVEYRVDKQAIVHLSVGKVSFGADKIAENIKAFFDSLQAHKPSTLKGAYIQSIFIATSQGPSIKVDLQ